MNSTVAPSTPLVRRALRTLAGAWAGGVVTNLIFAIVSAPQATRLTVAVVLLVVGSMVGWHESRDAGPWQAGDVRDGVTGWGIVAAIVIGAICGAVLPMPWSLVAGLAAFALIGVFAVEMPRPKYP